MSKDTRTFEEVVRMIESAELDVIERLFCRQLCRRLHAVHCQSVRHCRVLIGSIKFDAMKKSRGRSPCFSSTEKKGVDLWRKTSSRFQKKQSNE